MVGEQQRRKRSLDAVTAAQRSQDNEFKRIQQSYAEGLFYSMGEDPTLRLKFLLMLKKDLEDVEKLVAKKEPKLLGAIKSIPEYGAYSIENHKLREFVMALGFHSAEREKSEVLTDEEKKYIEGALAKLSTLGKQIKDKIAEPVSLNQERAGGSQAGGGREDSGRTSPDTPRERSASAQGEESQGLYGGAANMQRDIEEAERAFRASNPQQAFGVENVSKVESKHHNEDPEILYTRLDKISELVEKNVNSEVFKSYAKKCVGVVNKIDAFAKTKRSDSNWEAAVAALSEVEALGAKLVTDAADQAEREVESLKNKPESVVPPEKVEALRKVLQDFGARMLDARAPLSAEEESVMQDAVDALEEFEKDTSSSQKWTAALEAAAKVQVAVEQAEKDAETQKAGNGETDDERIRRELKEATPDRLAQIKLRREMTDAEKKANPLSKIEPKTFEFTNSRGVTKEVSVSPLEAEFPEKGPKPLAYQDSLKLRNEAKTAEAAYIAKRDAFYNEQKNRNSTAWGAFREKAWEANNGKWGQFFGIKPPISDEVTKARDEWIAKAAAYEAKLSVQLERRATRHLEHGQINTGQEQLLKHSEYLMGTANRFVLNPAKRDIANQMQYLDSRRFGLYGTAMQWVGTNVKGGLEKFKKLPTPQKAAIGALVVAGTGGAGFMLGTAALTSAAIGMTAGVGVRLGVAKAVEGIWKRTVTGRRAEAVTAARGNASVASGLSLKERKDALESSLLAAQTNERQGKAVARNIARLAGAGVGLGMGISGFRAGLADQITGGGGNGSLTTPQLGTAVGPVEDGPSPIPLSMEDRMGTKTDRLVVPSAGLNESTRAQIQEIIRDNTKLQESTFGPRLNGSAPGVVENQGYAMTGRPVEDGVMMSRPGDVRSEGFTNNGPQTMGRPIQEGTMMPRTGETPGGSVQSDARIASGYGIEKTPYQYGTGTEKVDPRFSREVRGPAGTDFGFDDAATKKDWLKGTADEFLKKTGGPLPSPSDNWERVPNDVDQFKQTREGIFGVGKADVGPVINESSQEKIMAMASGETKPNFNARDNGLGDIEGSSGAEGSASGTGAEQVVTETAHEIKPFRFVISNNDGEKTAYDAVEAYMNERFPDLNKRTKFEMADYFFKRYLPNNPDIGKAFGDGPGYKVQPGRVLFFPREALKWLEDASIHVDAQNGHVEVNPDGTFKGVQSNVVSAPRGVVAPLDAQPAPRMEVKPPDPLPQTPPGNGVDGIDPNFQRRTPPIDNAPAPAYDPNLRVANAADTGALAAGNGSDVLVGGSVADKLSDASSAAGAYVQEAVAKNPAAAVGGYAAGYMGVEAADHAANKPNELPKYDPNSPAVTSLLDTLARYVQGRDGIQPRRSLFGRNLNPYTSLKDKTLGEIHRLQTMPTNMRPAELKKLGIDEGAFNSWSKELSRQEKDVLKLEAADEKLTFEQYLRKGAVKWLESQEKT